MNSQGWFPLGLTGLVSMLSKGFYRVFPSTTIWKHQFFSSQPSLWSNSHIRLLEKIMYVCTIRTNYFLKHTINAYLLSRRSLSLWRSYYGFIRHWARGVPWKGELPLLAIFSGRQDPHNVLLGTLCPTEVPCILLTPLSACQQSTQFSRISLPSANS